MRIVVGRHFSQLWLMRLLPGVFEDGAFFKREDATLQVPLDFADFSGAGVGVLAGGACAGPCHEVFALAGAAVWHAEDVAEFVGCDTERVVAVVHGLLAHVDTADTESAWCSVGPTGACADGDVGAAVVRDLEVHAGYFGVPDVHSVDHGVAVLARAVDVHRDETSVGVGRHG